MDERTQQLLLSGCLLGGDHHSGMEVVDVHLTVVGQAAGFEIRPAVFVRIELRGIARKELQMHPPTATQPCSQQASLVGAQVIPDHHQRSLGGPQQMAKEVDDLLLADRPVEVKHQVPAQATPAGGDRQAADGRDTAVVTRPLPQGRCLASGRPSASDHRREQKAGLVDENQMGSASGGQPFDPRPVVHGPVGDGRLVTFWART